MTKLSEEMEGQMEADVYSPHKPTVDRCRSFSVKVRHGPMCVAPSGRMWTVDQSLEWQSVNF